MVYVTWGCQNYTGDRLNFGSAAEQAKAEGYKVEVLLKLLFILKETCDIVFTSLIREAVLLDGLRFIVFLGSQQAQSLG